MSMPAESKTIELLPKSTRWIVLFNGVVNTFIGVLQFTHGNPWTHWASILGILLVVAGPLMMVYAFVLFNPGNPYTPKVKIDDHIITIKPDLFIREKKIEWSLIREIVYHSFELQFNLKDQRVLNVDLPTDATHSVAIKQAIRGTAERKKIPVISG